MNTVKFSTKQLNILVEIMHGLGDTVCALSLLKGVRYLYPNARLTVLCKMNAGRDIIESSGIPVDEIIVLDVYKDIYITYKTILNLRKHHFDIGISAGITPVKKSKLFMKLCGVKKHIGFQASGTNKYDYDIHFVEANVKTLGLEFSDKLKPQLYVDSDSDEFVESYFKMLEKTKPIIGLCIGNADPSLTNRWLRIGRVFPKAWGITKMHDLLDLLVKDGNQVVLIGGSQEIPLLEELNEFLPTISIFGPTNPKYIGAFSDCSYFVEYETDCKYCFGTNQYVHCNHRRCLTEITPQHVMTKVKFVLRQLYIERNL